MPESTSNPLNQQSIESTIQDNDQLDGARILLIEDNRLKQPTVYQLLKKSGALVTTANSGIEAVEHISSDIFDLLLIDLQIADVDGITSQIRTLHQGKDLPIIAMTANVVKSEREGNSSECIDGQIAKSIAPNELIDSLSHWLGNPAKLTSHIPVTEDGNQVLIPETIAGIDLVAGLKNSIGNQKLYLKILESFLNQYTGIVDVLKSSPTPEEGRFISHSLKGACATIGATEMTHIASKLERSFRNGEGDTKALIVLMESQLSPLLINLEKIFPHNNIANK